MKITEEARSRMLAAHLAGIAGTAYSRYKLQWLVNHGYSMDDLLCYMDTAYSDFLDDSGGCEGLSPSGCMDAIEEIGLDSAEIWPGYDEFLDNEFQRPEIVRGLLDSGQFRDYEETMDALRRIQEGEGK